MKFLPQFEYDQNGFSEAVLILDLETYLPRALKMVDPSKREETVYLFDNVKETTAFEPVPDPELTAGYRLLFGKGFSGYRKPARRAKPANPDPSDTPIDVESLGI